MNVVHLSLYYAGSDELTLDSLGEEHRQGEEEGYVQLFLAAPALGRDISVKNTTTM